MTCLCHLQHRVPRAWYDILSPPQCLSKFTVAIIKATFQIITLILVDITLNGT